MKTRMNECKREDFREVWIVANFPLPSKEGLNTMGEGGNVNPTRAVGELMVKPPGFTTL